MFRSHVERLLHYPPDAGGGDGGGTTENNAGPSGAAAAADGGVISGTASDAMMKAFEASSASEGAAGPEAVAAEPAGHAGTVPTGAAASTSGAKGPQVPTGAATNTGPVPFDRHDAAVKNARQAGITEGEAKYAWAKDLDQESVSTAFGIARNLLSDTKGFAAKLAGELGMKLVPISEAASAPTGAAAGRAFTLPKADLRSEDGKGAYSDEALGKILTDFAAHMEAKFGDRVKPLEIMRQNLTEQEQRTAIHAEAHTAVDTMMRDFRAKPYFLVDDGKGNKVEHPNILRNLMAIPEQVRNRIGAEASMSRAYQQYLMEDVFPHIGNTAAAQVRNENARKAAASTGTIVPGGSGVTGKKERLRDGDVGGLAARMAEMAASTGTV